LEYIYSLEKLGIVSIKKGKLERTNKQVTKSLEEMLKITLDKNLKEASWQAALSLESVKKSLSELEKK